MATPGTVSFHTLGCKLNFAETSTIRRQFEAKGFAVRPFAEAADVCVINTCSVTDFADRKCRKAVRAALRANPEAKVVVIGCYAQLKPTEIAAIEGVDLVLGASEKFKVVDYIDQLHQQPEKGWSSVSDVSEVSRFEGAFSYGDRTRSFLKIQDGCDYNCSFCTIPQARGASRSSTLARVVDEATRMAEQGIQEIVLTGVNIGDFGKQPGSPSAARTERLIDLIRALDIRTDVPRYRISSIEPNLCGDDIIDFVAASRAFMPHFHMPLQSGNDTQLRWMRRRYGRDLYRQRVERIKQQIPHACIGADVIVGFPGETKADFEVTCDFIESLDVSYLHVFTYSERDNTAALQIQPVVPMGERRRRNAALRQLSDRKKRLFVERFIHSDRSVLLERGKKSGQLLGFTDNYIKVEVAAPEHLTNQILPIHLVSLSADGLALGRLKSANPLLATSLEALSR